MIQEVSENKILRYNRVVMRLCGYNREHILGGEGVPRVGIVYPVGPKNRPRDIPTYPTLHLEQ